MTKKYNLCYDVLTIIACLMVVFFHFNGVIYTFTDTISWKISVVVRCIVYSAIPIFFMLTGAKLMEYRSRYSTKEYAKKRLQRIGIPFLFWNLFYIGFETLLSRQLPFASVKEFVSMFLNSEFQDRYWFFWPLFAVYLAIPVISLVLEAKNHRKYLWYMVGVTFCLLWVIRPVLGILGIQYNSYMIMPACAGYLMYVVFGYLVSTEQISRAKRYALYIIAVVSGVFAVWYTISESCDAGKTVTSMLTYNCFPSGLTGAAIFVFVKQLYANRADTQKVKENIKLTKFTREVSSTCMGVWLTHSLGITVMSYVTKLPVDNYLWRFVFPLVVFVLCSAGVYIIKKIPLIKHIV